MSTFAPAETFKDREGAEDVSSRGGGPGIPGEGAPGGAEASIGTHHRARENLPGVMRVVLRGLEEPLRPL